MHYMQKKLLNFECFAVLTIDTDDNNDEPVPNDPELQGMYLTKDAVDQAIETLKAERRALAKARDEDWRRRTGRPWSFPDSTILYIVVPYSQVNSSLWDLEDDLREVAKLRARTVEATA